MFDLHVVITKTLLFASLFFPLKVSLQPEGLFDLSAIDEAIEADETVRLLHVQRSCGYSWRRSLPIQEIERRAPLGTVELCANSASGVLLWLEFEPRACLPFTFPEIARCPPSSFQIFAVVPILAVAVDSVLGYFVTDLAVVNVVFVADVGGVGVVAFASNRTLSPLLGTLHMNLVVALVLLPTLRDAYPVVTISRKKKKNIYQYLR